MSVRPATGAVWRRTLALAAVVLSAIGLPFGLASRTDAQTTGGGNSGDASPPAFAASAGASGVRLTFKMGGFPLSDTPVDGGGPTAEVVANSLGTSTGYAAFPDPGQFLVTVPALVGTVLQGGAAGLPGLPLPSFPSYPFFVQSDPNNAPDQTAGSGPYQVSAHSESGASNSKATAGFDTSAAGNVALVTSTSSIGPSHGDVVATAVSDAQGLTVGPLTIGQVQSTATETMRSDGSVAPRTELRVSGLRVAGIGIDITSQGLGAGGTTVPLPINSSLKNILDAAHITVEVVAPQTFPDRVIAPALKVTFPYTSPVAVPNVGQPTGTVTAIMGFATASMTGAVTSAEASVPDSGGAAGSGTTAAGTDSPMGASALAGGGNLGGGAPSPGGAPSGIPSAASPAAAGDVGSTGPTLRAATDRSLDAESTYLVLVGVGLLVGLLAHFVARWGLHSWITTRS